MVATLSSKGQITIPKKIRDLLALQQMDRLVFNTTAENWLLAKPLKKTFLDFGGSVKPKKKPEDFSKIRKYVLKKATQRNAVK